MAASEDFIDTFYHSISDLHSVRKSLNKEYSAELVEILKRAANDISDHTGKFLHNLHEMKPDEDTLKKMISASPSSLNYTDEFEYQEEDEYEYETYNLPIHSAMYHLESIRYVPLLAKEGVKHKVGGEDGRGGLFVEGRNGFKTLQLFFTSNTECDKAFVDVMKELKDANLFTKGDIKNSDLVYRTCRTKSYKQRCEFLYD